MVVVVSCETSQPPQDAGNHAQHGGFAAARGTDDEEHLAKMSDQRDTIIYGNLLGFAFTKPFGQTGCNNCLILVRFRFHWVEVQESSES